MYNSSTPINKILNTIGSYKKCLEIDIIEEVVLSNSNKNNKGESNQYQSP